MKILYYYSQNVHNIFISPQGWMSIRSMKDLPPRSSTRKWNVLDVIVQHTFRGCRVCGTNWEKGFHHDLALFFEKYFFFSVVLFALQMTSLKMTGCIMQCRFKSDHYWKDWRRRRHVFGEGVANWECRRKGLILVFLILAELIQSSSLAIYLNCFFLICPQRVSHYHNHKVFLSLLYYWFGITC